jgi:hypothetical protein
VLYTSGRRSAGRCSTVYVDASHFHAPDASNIYASNIHASDLHAWHDHASDSDASLPDIDVSVIYRSGRTARYAVRNWNDADVESDDSRDALLLPVLYAPFDGHDASYVEPNHSRRRDGDFVGYDAADVKPDYSAGRCDVHVESNDCGRRGDADVESDDSRDALLLPVLYAPFDGHDASYVEPDHSRRRDGDFVGYDAADVEPDYSAGRCDVHVESNNCGRRGDADVESDADRQRNSSRSPSDDFAGHGIISACDAINFLSSDNCVHPRDAFDLVPGLNSVSAGFDPCDAVDSVSADHCADLNRADLDTTHFDQNADTNGHGDGLVRVWGSGASRRFRHRFVNPCDAIDPLPAADDPRDAVHPMYAAHDPGIHSGYALYPVHPAHVSTFNRDA